MKPKVKFIHTADLHLGSRLKINNYDNIDQNYKNAVYESFKKIIDGAIKKAVDFVLIAGDVFDNEARSVKATRIFINQCKRLQKHNIDVYIINGNHDPYRLQGELLKPPENVYICDSEEVSKFKVYRDDKLIARVLGQSYRSSSESRKMYTYYTTADQSVYNIGLLHTQLDPKESNYVPVSKNELLEHQHIDYWALGHIHDKQVINDHIPFIIYSGIPQGRDIGEVGEGGYYFVNLEVENTYIEFVKTSNFIYKKFEINLENMTEDTLSELHYYLKEQLEDYYKDLDKENTGYILRIILKGRTELYDLLQDQNDEVIEDLIDTLKPYFLNRSPSLLINNIVDRTAKKIENIEEIKDNNPFIKEFINFLRDIKEDEKEKIKLKQSMGKIWNPEVDPEKQDPKEFQITDEEFEELFEKAQEKIIREFVERSDL